MSRIKSKPKTASKKKSEFNAQAFLDSAGVDRKVRHFKKAEIIFQQGSPADTVMYIQEGAVKITALSAVGKEAIIGYLAPRRLFWRRMHGGPADARGKRHGDNG